MIFYKTGEEIERIRKSSLLVGKTLAEIAKKIEPGVSTLALDKLAEEFIRDHGAEGESGNNHHASGGGKATNKDQNRQPFRPILQGKFQDETIRVMLPAFQRGQTADRDGNNDQTDQDEVKGKQPAGVTHIPGVITFNNGHVKLPGKTKNSPHAEKHERKEFHIELVSGK